MLEGLPPVKGSRQDPAIKLVEREAKTSPESLVRCVTSFRQVVSIVAACCLITVGEFLVVLRTSSLENQIGWIRRTMGTELMTVFQPHNSAG